MHDALRRAVLGSDRSDSAGEEELGSAARYAGRAAIKAYSTA